MRRLIACPPARRLLALAAVGAAAWMALLAALPCLGVREKLAARLAERLGHPVGLAAVRLTCFGDVRLHDLRVGPADRPWLFAPEVAVDLAWLDLLRGRATVRSIAARGVHLDLERDADGRLNALPERRRPDDPGRTTAHRGDQPDDGDAVRLHLRDSTLDYHDHPTRTRLRLTNLDAEATWSDDAIALDELTAELNGGRLALAARLEHSGRETTARGDLAIEDAEVDPALGAIGFVVPVGDAAGLTTARLDLRLRLQAEADAPENLARAVRGSGRLVVREIEPMPGSLVATLAQRVGSQGHGGPSSIVGSFRVGPDGVATDDMRLLIGTFPIAFAGRTDLEGRLDYLIRAEGLAATIDRYGSRLPDRARRALRELDLPKKLEDVADLHVGGHAGSPTLSLGKPGMPREPLLDAASLERLAERLRGREPARR